MSYGCIPVFYKCCSHFVALFSTCLDEIAIATTIPQESPLECMLLVFGGA